MNAQSNRWHILLLLFVIWETATAQAQSVCEAVLLVAEQKFQQGDFDGALNLIDRCLGEKKVTKQNQASAYQLLGKVYIARDEKDDREQAKKAFGKMLKVNSKMKLDKETPEVMAVFNEAKVAYEQKRRRINKRNKLLLIGAGSLATTGIAAVIIFKPTTDGPPESFVQPPGRPPR